MSLNSEFEGLISVLCAIHSMKEDAIADHQPLDERLKTLKLHSSHIDTAVNHTVITIQPTSLVLIWLGIPQGARVLLYTGVIVSFVNTSSERNSLPQQLLFQNMYRLCKHTSISTWITSSWIKHTSMSINGGNQTWSCTGNDLPSARLISPSKHQTNDIFCNLNFFVEFTRMYKMWLWVKESKLCVYTDKTTLSYFDAHFHTFLKVSEIKGGWHSCSPKETSETVTLIFNGFFLASSSYQNSWKESQNLLLLYW